MGSNKCSWFKRKAIEVIVLTCHFFPLWVSLLIITAALNIYSFAAIRTFKSIISLPPNFPFENITENMLDPLQRLYITYLSDG